MNNIGCVLFWSTQGTMKPCGTSAGANGAGDFVRIFIGDPSECEKEAHLLLEHWTLNEQKINKIILVVNDTETGSLDIDAGSRISVENVEGGPQSEGIGCVAWCSSGKEQAFNGITRENRENQFATIFMGDKDACDLAARDFVRTPSNFNGVSMRDALIIVNDPCGTWFGSPVSITHVKKFVPNLNLSI